MAAQPEILQSTLPLDLFDRLHRVRARYAAALKAAAVGDFSHEADLQTVTRLVGRLLAREARKRPEDRGGLRMLDISLAVDKLCPELRGWTRYEIARRERQRVLSVRVPPGSTLNRNSGKAS
ncbi:MAG TPA: hypothetical protein VGK74_22980 [Symbiobacteriaceae bacterium]|jgi:hypothetical protein